MADVVVNERFWRGRRVLVTGHTGFKGSWLSLWLQRLGTELVGISDAVPTEPSLFERARVGEGMTSVWGDVRDLDVVSAAVDEHRPQVVLHLAAQPIVKAGFEDPVGTYTTNVIGTAHVLEAVRRAGCARAVVNVTTDKVYENREWEWGYREDDELGGHDPYASSKACSEIVTAAYRASFFGRDGSTRVASARAGNVIGGGDWARDRLIPDLLLGARERQPVQIRNPAAIRPWQHVLNPLLGYLMLAEHLWNSAEHARAWNFGPDAEDDRTVGDVADRMAALWGDGLGWEHDESEHPDESHYLRLDSSLAKLHMGWEPRWRLERALESIVEFARADEAGDDLQALVLRQIEEFDSEAAAR